jgi:hypothetical protein
MLPSPIGDLVLLGENDDLLRSGQFVQQVQCCHGSSRVRLHSDVVEQQLTAVLACRQMCGEGGARQEVDLN